MKQRFSSLDVKVIAHELQESLATLRVSNIYDLSSKILLFKFAKPDNKKQLVVDTGFRTHLTEFGRTTAAAPSAFVARLRKFLKTRRVTSVSQVGTDRILEFKFSDGQYRLFLEFFASGNIILTDADLNILAISRNVSENEGQEPQRIGLQYSLENRQNFKGIPPLTKERVRSALQKSVDQTSANASVARKGKVKPGAELRKSLALSITEVPPVLVDHILQGNNFDLTKTLPEILENETLFDELFRSVSEARQTVEKTTSSGPCKGYIFAKYRTPQTPDDPEPARRENLLYEDFHPFLPKKLAEDDSVAVLEFENYNHTVDEFFSSLEGQKLESRVSEREATAQRRMEAARQEQAKRIEGLQEIQALNFRKAAAIETNAQRVQEAMDAVNGLLAQGMDWVDVGKLVEREKKRHNPVAEIIKTPLRLEENIITLTLAEEEFETEDDDPYETDEDSGEEDSAADESKNKSTDNALLVDINLSLSPWSNAREYYGERKVAAVKAEKTQMQAARALKNTEQKINQDLKKGLKQEKALLQPIRKQMWFEKFAWFISSDGYLVLGGKDAAQNEMLYKRYLRKGDVYCHADLRGASSVIVKNNPKTPDAPIPPSTLAQAGTLSVCTSEAWDAKAGMSAWWVNAEQVSKSAPSGEFLSTGSFMVRGTKNFLPPAQLLMGLGFMFRISEESKARHVKHRLNEEDSGAEALPEKSQEQPGSKDDESALADDASADYDSSEGEYEGGDEQNEKRENPLQGLANGVEGDDAAGAERGVSEMKLADGASKEGATPTDDASDDEQEKDEKDDEQDVDIDTNVPETATEVSEVPTNISAGASAQSSVAASPKKAAPKRVSKAKAKKLAKYKYQDEEDRAAYEALVGSKAGKQKAEAEAKAKEEREAELAAQKERRRAQHQKQQKQAAEHEEIRRVMMEEGVEMLEDDEALKTTSLDDLVGTPLPGDEIAEVIPVCAPWNALGKFKYKAKLQPGTTKKGKAVKEILERFKADSGRKGTVDEQARDKEKMWPREAELIKALKPEEVVNAVPVGKVRIMMAGGGGGGGKGSGGGKGGSGRGGKRGKGKK
ncbi:hypothetical protein ACRE_029800 [Hapsidospora chrysogenum ATCC 11550]|uniref:Ribosome quality control complex subunit 2 n=1 Tax=Hapsidospora chrysogenum (strain ATCC 11550 / CBS 779.69 / DSM 880 / IAM 14645 / JCM 23072 / IMI 49137) TaxID=857340 RepID=A0A086T9Z6_HAPC1|nr:hypothetical protein ACRE_029800 [Hapsidospora chrysogenum ATCC 11550]